jgi:hypothetical protein
MQIHTVSPHLIMVYEQAAAFGLSRVVYVPKIELYTVAELSAFWEKARMVNSSSTNYF